MTQPSPPRTMATRVAWAAAGSALFGGTLAAIIAVVTVDALVTDHSDQRLLGATDTLAGELDEDSKEDDKDSLDDILADENEEIVTSGIRLAVYDHREVIAGERWAPWAPDGACVTEGTLGSRVRSCGRRYGRWTLVAAAENDRASMRVRFALAGLVAMALGAGVAAVASLRLTRWAVRPLSRLSERLERSDPRTATSLVLDEAVECREVLDIQTALAHLMQRVDVLLRQARRFAADAAHELRTPLSVLRAELELLREVGGEQAQAADLDTSLRRVDRLTQVLDKLLLLASPTEGLQRNFVAVSMDDVVNDAIDKLPEQQRARVDVVSADEGLVHGDAVLLDMMLGNALTNALKFSGSGRVRVRVATHGDVVVGVEDDGPGIATELRERVFEPFYRARPDATEGHGLGLALIGHIAEAHRGHARFVPSTRGAALEMVIPRWTSASGDVE